MYETKGTVVLNSESQRVWDISSDYVIQPPGKSIQNK